ncbi:MAG TPA: hypothetical protein VJ826_05340 [Candidatus Polarisedimenticolaceae bacterium]|nr:hypothetical protein [Candidatus Polarisedimenticolaceae bacterium]
MELYRIPRRQVQARILLDDGRTLDGTVFTTDSVPGGRPEDVLHLLNDPTEDFVPLVCGDDSFLLNKAGIIWVQLTGATAEEVAEGSESGRAAPVRMTLAGGLSLVGTLSIVMPPERARVIDYMNAAGRFLPLFGDGTVTLVRRSFVVSVRSSEAARRN